MKKKLQWTAWLIMAALVVGINFKASAVTQPTLTQAWKITEGLPEKMDARQSTVVDGKFYIQNKNTGVVEIWTKDGKSAETLTSAAGSWPAIGTDDANNIIVRIDATWPNSMPQDVAQFRIFPAAGGDPVDLQLNFTDAGLESAPARMDFFGHAKGNLLDENEGGVLYLASQNTSVIYVVTVIGGVQDVDNTYTASVSPLTFNNMATIYAKGENDVIICNRGAGNNYIWGTFEGESLDLSKILVTPDKQSTNGCAIFTMGGKDYIAYPCGTDPKGAEYFDGFAIAEMSTDAANPKLVEHVAEFTTTSGFQSMWLTVEPVSDTKANVYQYFPGGCIAMFTFELASSNPDPEQLYIIGEVDGAESWKPNSGIELQKKEDGTFSARVTFNGNGSWGIAGQLGATEDDWTTVNALRYGPAKDMDVVKKGVATAISKNTNAFKILVGTYDVTVDLAAKTVICEQVVTPSDRAVYAYGLTAGEEGTDYVLAYSLNTAATTVTIKVTDKDGAQVGELIEAPANAGNNFVKVAKASYPGENLSWEVTATGTAIEGYNLLTPKTMDFAAYAPYGVDVDKNPESKNFGYVYVTNSGKGSCKKTDGTVECLQGLYVYNPALQRMTIDGKTVLTGGITFETINTYCDPRTVKVANDGSVFVGCNSINHSVLYKINPAELDTWKPVFEGTQDAETGVIKDANGNFVAGGTIGMSFVGKGNDQQLFVLGSQNRATSFSINDMFMSVYNIGYKSAWNTVPSKVLPAPEGMTNTQANTVCADANGGYWVAQHRAGGNMTEPTLMHFDADGNRNYARFSADTEIPNFCAGGGLAINKEGTLMAVSNSGAGATTKGAVALYSVSYDDQNVPTLTLVESFMTELGTNINDIAFDYAGNMHIVSNSGEWYMAYSGKKADNTETVKCSVENQLNGNLVYNAPANLQGIVNSEEKCVVLTWDAPAEGETPLYYTLSITNGDDVKVIDGIAEAAFKHYPGVDDVKTYTYVVSAVYAGQFAVPSSSIDVLYKLSGVDAIGSDEAASKVYPNPTTGMINIESAAGIYKVEVFNGSSQMIEQVNASGDEKAQLDITGQPSGIYFIKINDKAVVKVIKK